MEHVKDIGLATVSSANDLMIKQNSFIYKVFVVFYFSQEHVIDARPAAVSGAIPITTSSPLRSPAVLQGDMMRSLNF